MNFADKLIAAVQSKGNSVCVGLDPRLNNLPAALKPTIDPADQQSIAAAFESFCKQVIDVVAPIVPIVKPQSAFFEAVGPHGVEALGHVVQYASQKGLLVLMDAKRGDIGSTAQAYAQAYLEPDTSELSSDALTVNPYMGVDTLEPFVKVSEANGNGLFVLVKTSNPGSGHFQDQTIDSEKARLYELVADQVESLSKSRRGDSGYGPVGAVVGATYPEQLRSLRQRMPSSLLLIPGFGAQGGGVADVKPGFDAAGLGAIVNSSRGIIFAYEKPEHSESNWQAAVESECQKMANQLSVEAMRSTTTG